MAAISSSVACCASPGIASSHRSLEHSLCSQRAISSAPVQLRSRSTVAARKPRACISAVKDDSIYEGARKAGLAGLLLPSVAAMLIGGPFAPEAKAEMTSAEYYKSLMESVKKNQSEAASPALLQAPPVAATPVKSAAPAADQEIDFSSLFSSSLLDTPKKGEAPKAAPEENALSGAELRARRVAEVAQKEREEAERKAAEQAQQAKAQAEARAKEEREKAEKEAQQKAKEASNKVKQAQESTAKAAGKSSKTHGYLPLFVAQFLFLALYLGGITLAFFLPESQSKKINATLDELVKTVGPLAEKAKPYADKAVAAGSKLVRQARPYVGKAAQEAAPLLKKAVDASKPLVSEAQAKAGEVVEKVKASSRVD